MEMNPVASFASLLVSTLILMPHGKGSKWAGHTTRLPLVFLALLTCRATAIGGETAEWENPLREAVAISRANGVSLICWDVECDHSNFHQSRSGPPSP